MSEPIRPITSLDIDEDGNTPNFWILVDKINEVIDKINDLERLINKKNE